MKLFSKTLFDEIVTRQVTYSFPDVDDTIAAADQIAFHVIVDTVVWDGAAADISVDLEHSGDGAYYTSYQGTPFAAVPVTTQGRTHFVAYIDSRSAPMLQRARLKCTQDSGGTTNAFRVRILVTGRGPSRKLDAPAKAGCAGGCRGESPAKSSGGSSPETVPVITGAMPLPHTLGGQPGVLCACYWDYSYNPPKLTCGCPEGLPSGGACITDYAAYLQSKGYGYCLGQVQNPWLQAKCQLEYANIQYMNLVAGCDAATKGASTDWYGKWVVQQYVCPWLSQWKANAQAAGTWSACLDGLYNCLNSECTQGGSISGCFNCLWNHNCVAQGGIGNFSQFQDVFSKTRQYI